MAFAAAATIAQLSMILGCRVFIDTLPYGPALLEESLVYMGNVEDQQEMALQSALVRHPKYFLLSWRNSTELLWRCEDNILSLGFTTPVILDNPSALTHPILWCPLDKEITLVEMFGDIGTGLAAMLEVGLTV